MRKHVARMNMKEETRLVGILGLGVAKVVSFLQ